MFIEQSKQCNVSNGMLAGPTPGAPYVITKVTAYGLDNYHYGAWRAAYCKEGHVWMTDGWRQQCSTPLANMIATLMMNE